MIEGKRVIDAHTHIYPAKIAAKAIAGTGKFYGIAPNELDGSPDTLLREDRMGGIDLSLVCSVATTPRQVSSINRYLASVAAEYPGQIEAIGTLHPESEDQSADVEEAVSLGLRGVKLHPDIQGFRLDDERCMEIFALCEGRLPVLLHTGDKRYDYSNPNRLATVLRAFPRLQVVGAHFGCYTVWEQAGELRAAIRRLDPADQELFFQFYFLDQTVGEIAAVTGQNPATLRSRLKRGREKLKKILTERGVCCD